MRGSRKSSALRALVVPGGIALAAWLLMRPGQTSGAGAGAARSGRWAWPRSPASAGRGQAGSARRRSGWQWPTASTDSAASADTPAASVQQPGR